MGYDSMEAWTKGTFQFNDRIQQRGGSWHGSYSFDDDFGRTIVHADYKPPPSPSAQNHRAPSFNTATSQWSPPHSPSTNSLGHSSTPPRMESPEPIDSPPATPMSPKDKHDLADKLYAAASAGDLQHIHLLLDLGAPINSPSMVEGVYESFKPPKSGYLSALAGATEHNQLAAVKLLLSNGAELNPTMKQSSSSPLHQACKNDHAQMARYLLKSGANVDAPNCYKSTPLMYAVKYGGAELVSILLDYKPNLHLTSFIGVAAIHFSVWPGREDGPELLLRAGADANHQMMDGSTPLHCAAQSGLTAVAACLLRYGADPTRQNDEGKTPLVVAEENRHAETAAVIREWQRQNRQ